MINLEYPDAIHVEGSVWEVQKAGRLALPDMNRQMATAVEPTDFVLLLVDEMMWNRFVFRHGHIELQADISEPEEDVDLVAVTETSVIMAIIDASMSLV